MLYLRTPGPQDEARVMDFRAEFAAEGDGQINGGGGLGRADTFDAWLKQVLNNRYEETVAPGLVPSSTLMCIREEDERLVGIIDIRHRLNDHLRQEGGHIGYSVRKSDRHKGYGKEMLRLALTRVCPAVGIERALITCDRDNEASRRTIMACGGSFEGENELGGRVVQRYWAPVRAFSVRKARAEDGLAICQLNHDSLGYDDPSAQTCARVARLVGKQQNKLWIAEKDGQAVGYLHGADYEVSYRAPQKNVLTLAVAPDHQGTGIGRALLEEVQAWAKWDGCDGVRLISGMGREKAHAFYQACGYHLRKEYKNFEKLI